eukprot:COSAG02_NODE_635_length_19251_cov_32.350982_2_plen_127_part_00
MVRMYRWANLESGHCRATDFSSHRLVLRLKYEMLAECTTSDWFHALPLYRRARAAAAADRAARDVKSRANDSTSVTTGNAATDGRQLGACTSKIEKLYRDVVVLDDASAIAAQLDSGVCVRYNLGH